MKFFNIQGDCKTMSLRANEVGVAISNVLQIRDCFFAYAHRNDVFQLFCNWLILIIIFLAYPNYIFSLPEVSDEIPENVEINTNEQKMNVTVNGDREIIHWNTFNIDVP